MHPIAIGVAIGAQRLTATTIPADFAPPIIRTPVLTLAPDRPAECGTPTENPRVRGDGVTLSGFVERVGDPVPISSPDGNTHRAEVLTAAAVKSVIRGLLSQAHQPPPIVVTHPAFWPEHAVESLRAAFPAAGLPASVQLVPDMTAALAQVRRQREFPSAGIVALVDAGATGTTVALVDAAASQIVGSALRVDEPSGNDLDHALMRHVLDVVVDDRTLLANPDPNLLGALSRLRSQCTAAKEQLSTATACSIAVDLPMFHGDVRLTRSEFEDIAAQPLGRTVGALRELLDRESVTPENLRGIYAFGGSAAVPLLTQRLSGELHLPVAIDPNPYLTIAAGAARIAADGAGRGAETTGPIPVQRPGAIAIPLAAAAGLPPAPPTQAFRQPPTGQRPVTAGPGGAGAGAARSDPPAPPARGAGAAPTPSQPRPALTFTDNHPKDDDDQPPRHGRRLLLIGAAVAFLLAAAAGTAFALSNNSADTSDTSPSVTISTTTATTTATATTTPEVTETEVVAPVVPEPTVFVPDETNVWTPPSTTDAITTDAIPSANQGSPAPAATEKIPAG